MKTKYGLKYVALKQKKNVFISNETNEKDVVYLRESIEEDL